MIAESGPQQMGRLGGFPLAEPGTHKLVVDRKFQVGKNCRLDVTGSLQKPAVACSIGLREQFAAKARKHVPEGLHAP